MRFTSQISHIQSVRNQQTFQDNIRKNILDMNKNYDIRFACLNGQTGNVNKDSIRTGYFVTESEYQNITEAISKLDMYHAFLIENGSYKIGKIYKTLNDCPIPNDIYNLYTGQKVCEKENPVKSYNLDNVRTPDQMRSLYEKSIEKLFSENKISENIDIKDCWEEYDHDANMTETMSNIWERIHNKLLEQDVDEKNLVIEGLAYTKFII